MFLGKALTNPSITTEAHCCSFRLFWNSSALFSIDNLGVFAYHTLTSVGSGAGREQLTIKVS